MTRLAILSTHPIQYNAPLFRLMAEQEEWNVHVFFSRTADQVSYDPDFQREVAWDTPLIEGYHHSHFNASGPEGYSVLKQSIQDFGPDALLVYGWNFPGHRKIMKAFHGKIPIGFRGDSHLLNPMPVLKRWLRRGVLQSVYRHINIAFSVGSANTDYFIWGGVPGSRIALAPHAVDTSFWTIRANARQEEARQWRTQLGIPDTAPIVGFAGKLEPIKQVDRLIQAFRLMSFSEAHLVIAGTGPDKEKLHQQANGHSRIHFVGFVNQSRMPIFYRMLSVFALPSSSETWGLSVNEALACGTRCLVSDRVGCAYDVFGDPRLGAIVKWNRPDQWPATIRAILDEPDIESGALRDFESTYSYQAFIRALPKLWSQ